MLEVYDYLTAETARSDSPLHNFIDTNRFGAAGHSLGGTTALATAARDGRMQAVVALDPVYHTGGPFGGDPVWNPEAEAPPISAPTAILGAPPDTCNAEADYADIYPLVGATHKASYLLQGASHCAFTDPGNDFCTFTCGGDAGADKTALSQKYMTAWFNYYLHNETAMFTYLFGAEAAADASSGLTEMMVDTGPHSVTATGLFQGVRLTWDVYAHPMVAGYTVYRRLPSGSFGPPYAQVGVMGGFVDTAVVPGQLYFYRVCSHDPANQIHPCAAEVSAAPYAFATFLPLIRR